MRTLGIDLAAAPERTAACVITWASGRGRAEVPSLGHDDAALLRMIRDAARTGIDAPFGWPDEFVDTLRAHRDGGPLPAATREELRLRTTDRVVRDALGRTPLSASTDKLGVVALRCAGLLAALAAAGDVIPRDGAGRVVEVYPAGALVRWGYDANGYKRANGRRVRADLVGRFCREVDWLDLAPGAADALAASDDAFDALLAALVARAVAIGRTDVIPAQHVARAKREGWIHVPAAGSLASLGGDPMSTGSDATR